MTALIRSTEPQEAASASKAALFACLGVMAVTLVLGAATLPYLPPVIVLILWLGLGLVAGVPLAANAAVARGHTLKTMNPANPLHWLLRGGVLRVLLCGTLGICGAGILLVRLSEGGFAAWIGAVTGGVAVLAVMRSGGGISARLNAPVHDAVRLRRAAIWVGIATTAVASGLASGLLGPGDPALGRTAASALVAEGFEAHRFLDGVLAWALGAVAALDLLHPVVEALLAAIALAMSGAAVAALTVAALMPPRDWARAVAIASDAPEVPGLHRPALLCATLLTILTLFGALRAEMWLTAREPDMRPVAQLQISVERIGMTLHPPGTYAGVMAGRAALAAQDAAALTEIRNLVDAGFDSMADEVDPFLNGYYSLRAEYWRIGVALRGLFQRNAEAAMRAHLATQLTAALDSDTQFRAITDRLAELGLAEAQAAQAAREMALTEMGVIGLNPARLRLVADFPAFAPTPELRSLGLTSTIEARLGGSVTFGVLGAVVARRIVQRLVRRGVLRLGARALMATVPFLGTVVAVGTDAAALKLEEHYNRADFRAEILDALEQQRAAIHQVLDTAVEG